jgi:hypothetical protein
MLSSNLELELIRKVAMLSMKVPERRAPKPQNPFFISIKYFTKKSLLGEHVPTARASAGVQEYVLLLGI